MVTITSQFIWRLSYLVIYNSIIIKLEVGILLIFEFNENFKR